MTLRAIGAFGLGLALLATGPPLQAQSVPWTPTPAGRHALEWLVDEAGLDLPTTQWPLPRNAVHDALAALPKALPPSLETARARVEHELQAQDASRLTLMLRNHADGLPGFGDDETPGSAVALRSSTLNLPHAALQVGGRIEVNANPDRANTQFRLDDTALVTEAFGVQLQAFAHRAWWSPGWQSALALGNNMPALAGFGLQRASASTSASPWLAWLGPWSVDLFAAQDEGVSQPANPYVLGARFTARPFSHLEVGLTRTAQWGGRGRPHSLRSLWDLIANAGVNADDPAQRAVDPGNEMAGFDLRLRCPDGLHCAAYTQLIGEDDAGGLPSHFLGLYGLEFAAADGNSRTIVEYTETGCHSPVGHSFLKGCAYRNYAYPQGYADAGRWMGSSFGPDSRVVTLGWLEASSGTLLKLHLGTIGARSGAFVPSFGQAAYAGHLTALSARRDLPWGDAVLTPSLDWQRVATAEGTRQATRIGATLSISLDDEFGAGRALIGNGLADADAAWWRPALVGVALIGASTLLDRPLDNYASGRSDNPSVKALRHAGNLLPFAGAGLAGASWLMQRGSVEGDVGYAALAAGVTAAAATEVIKIGVDRARPTDGLGASHFGGGARADSSFPSFHAALAWAVVTPYAEHYQAPWLYGAAALTNAARVMGRDHWFSDTVAGAVIGYWVGDRFYRASGAGDDRRAGASWWLAPRSVYVSLPFN